MDDPKALKKSREMTWEPSCSAQLIDVMSLSASPEAANFTSLMIRLRSGGE